MRSSMPSIISEANAPGAMQFTLMLNGAHSLASASVMRFTAVLVTAYSDAPPPLVTNPAIEEMLTMRPGCLSLMRRRANSHEISHGARRLVPSTASTSSVDILVANCASGIPALFTRMSTVPTSASMRSNAADSAASSRTSSGIAIALPPCALMSLATASTRSMRRPAQATVAPASASTCAKRSPRPDDAPVTSAMWPVRSM